MIKIFLKGKQQSIKKLETSSTLDKLRPKLSVYMPNETIRFLNKQNTVKIEEEEGLTLKDILQNNNELYLIQYIAPLAVVEERVPDQANTTQEETKRNGMTNDQEDVVGNQVKILIDSERELIVSIGATASLTELRNVLSSLIETPFVFQIFGSDIMANEENEKYVVDLLGNNEQVSVRTSGNILQTQNDEEYKNEQPSDPNQQQNTMQTAINTSSKNEEEKISEQTLTLTQQSDIFSLYQEACLMPNCSEKSLQLLKYYFACKRLGYEFQDLESAQKELHNIDELIEKEFEILKDRLTLEEIFNQIAKKSYQDCANNIKNQNWNEAYKRVETLLKQNQSVNIKILKKLIEKVEDAAKQIINKNIILLLGGTGAGKSTTIHFMAGSKMGHTTVNGIPHIEAIQIQNQMLKNVRSSPYAVSETRYITPVEVDFKSIGSLNKGTITLVDSPGFGDTSGPEVDIANSVGVIKAIHGCESVRPVILISSKSMGDKMQGIKDIAEIIVNMIDGVSDHLSSFTYIFTKFPEDQKESINSVLNEFFDKLTQEQQDDENFFNLCFDLVTQTKNGAITIDLIKDQPATLLDKIKKVKPILQPDEVFKMFISRNSQEKANSQVQKHQLCIQRALKRADYQLIKYKLDDLQFLYLLLKEQSINQTYLDCVNDAKIHLTANYEDAEKDLTRYLSYNNTLRSDDVVQFKQKVDLQLMAEELIRSHLEGNVPYGGAFTLLLHEQVQQIAEEIKEKDIVDSFNAKMLEKIKLIAEKFIEFDSLYKEICNEILKKQEAIIDCFKQSLHSFEFSKAQLAIIQYQVASQLYQDYFDSESQNANLYSAQIYLVTYLTEIAQSQNKFFDKNLLQSLEIKQINEISLQLSRATNEFDKLDKELKNKISFINEQFVGNIFNLFENTLKQIGQNDQQDDQSSQKNSEAYFDQLNNLYQIQAIQQQTSEKYFQKIESLKGFIQGLKLEIQQLINKIGQRYDSKDYARLSQNLSSLENLKWFETYQNGIFIEAKDGIKQKLLSHLEDVAEEIRIIKISLENTEQIKEVDNKLREINGMMELKKYIPEIESTIKNTTEEFRKIIKVIFDDISSSFRAKDQASLTYEPMNPKRVSRSLQFINKCSGLKYVSQEECEAVHSLVNNYIEDKGMQAQKLWTNIRNELQTFNDDDSNKTSLVELSGLLFDIYQEAENLRKNYLEVYELYACEDQQNKWFKDLKNLGENLRIDMVQLDQAGNQNDLKIKLNVAKSLRTMDEYLSKEQSFLELYQTYQNKFFQNAADQSQQILKQIDMRNYSETSNIFQTLQQSQDQTSLQIMTKSKNFFNKSVQEIIEETTILSSRMLIRENFNQEKIQIIVKQIKSLADANLNLQDYLNPKDVIEINIQKIQQTLNTCLQNYIKHVLGLINNHNFIEAKDQQIHLQVLCDLLGKNCSAESINQCEGLQKQMDQALENLINNYKEMDPDQYLVNPPKEIFDKLKQGNNSDYNTTLNQIQTIIQKKLRQRLIDISKMTSDNERNYKLRRLDLVIKTLPENTKKIIENDVEKTQEDITKTLDDRKNELAIILNNDNIIQIAQTYDQALKEGNKQITNEIRETIRKNAQELKIHISQNIYDLDQVIIDKLEKLDGYKTFIATNIPSESLQVFKDINQIISKQLNSNLAILNKIFNMDLVKIDYEIQINQISLNRSFGSVYDEESSPNKQERENNIKVMEWTFKFIKYLLQDHVKINDPNFDFVDVITKAFLKIDTSINENYSQYNEAIRGNLPDIVSLKINLKQMKQWDPIFTQLKQNSDLFGRLNPQKLQIFEQTLNKQQSYLNVIKKVSEKLRKVKTEFFTSCDNLINDKTSHLQKQREKFYNKLGDQLKMFSQTKLLNDCSIIDFNTSSAEEECVKKLVQNFELIVQKTEEIIKSSELNEKDCQKLNIHYNQIDSFVKCIDQAVINARGQKSQIDNEFVKRLDEIQSKIVDEKEIAKVADQLIKIQAIAMSVNSFKEICDQKIDQSIMKFKEKQGSWNIDKLGIILEKSTIGKLIITDNKQLAGFAKALTNQKISKHGIDYVLENIEGTDIDKEKLKKRYEQYIQIFDQLLIDNLKPDMDLQAICNNLKTLIGKTVFEADKKSQQITYSLKLNMYGNIPKLLAHLSVLYTLLNAQYYFECKGAEGQDNYLFKTHAAQVISIFRIFGCGDSFQKLVNNLVQIGTGEGKSVTLALSSALLALLGFDVSCACYSQYLSQRDYNSFKSLFELLGIAQDIHYGAFNEICETIINQNGDVRKIVENVITGAKQNPLTISKSVLKPKILLIDEVDVFFSKDFYGNTYLPVASLKDSSISDLIKLIWTLKDTKLIMKDIQNSNEYQQVCLKFEKWAQLIENSVKNMISEISGFQTPSYIVQTDKIAYKEQDGVSFNISYGYKTMFAYLFEHQKGNISQQSLEDSLCIEVNCGQFSFAEIPSEFVYIMGVTGTLKTLSESELKVIKEEYNINKFTYSPSVYGQNNRTFYPKSDCKVETSNDYYNQLTREIQDRMVGTNPETKRAVLVFFEDKNALSEFYDSSAYEQIRQNEDQYQTLKLTEEDTKDEKEAIVRKAPMQGTISFYTKCFGRGTDFISRDSIVTSNGGLHVIQTFLSEDYSEEVQIMGRTARQGDRGSFSLVLLDKDLEKFLVTIEEIKNNKENIYNVLNIKRTIFFNDQYQNNKQYINSAKQVHKDTQDFLQNIKSNDLEKVKEFLLNRNQGKEAVSVSKTIVAMDGTGSMRGLILKAKNTVGTMFERAYECLKTQGYPEGSFELQFIIYRSYNSPEDDLIEASGWEQRPEKLRLFIQKISARGGTGEEAVEVGLQYANSQHLIDPISQVILIGDAPPTPTQQVAGRRATLGSYYYYGRSFWSETNYGELYWSKTKFKVITDYLKESQILKTNGIPVHAFYMNDSAKKEFEEISRITGGQSQFLDVNSEYGADILTELVTTTILKNVGKGKGKSEELVNEYKKRYKEKQ